MSQPVGLVLAGGVGRRLGRSKADLVLCGRTLAARAAATLAPLCRHVVVSIAHGAANPAPGLPTLEDPPPGGCGPLVGIAEAFRAHPADLLVLACDYPCVVTAMLARLLEKGAAASAGTAAADIVLVTDGAGRDHPLVALWRYSCRAEVAAAVERSEWKVGDVVDRLRVRRVRPEDVPVLDLDGLLVNVNRPEDLAALGETD